MEVVEQARQPRGPRAGPGYEASPRWAAISIHRPQSSLEHISGPGPQYLRNEVWKPQHQNRLHVPFRRRAVYESGAKWRQYPALLAWRFQNAPIYRDLRYAVHLRERCEAQLHVCERYMELQKTRLECRFSLRFVPALLPVTG